jgi:predicted nucleic acid-binding protein
MISEKKKIWEPIEGIDGNYWLEFVVDNREFIKQGNSTKINRIIKFRLRNDKEENKVIDLTFDDIASYRITNESYSNNSIDLIESEKEKLQNKAFWGFYVIENSSFIELIEKQTGIPATIYNFQHYYIATIDDTIDIISNAKPIVKLLYNQ